ncbi:hypothetical protein [Staphylococcus warneri]|uniref:hypothetical protein n=3 Tax=Bacillati TaxID=1783272 RepID=UPI0034CFD398
MKKKIATLVAGTVLLAPIVSVLPNDSHTPNISNEASAKTKSKYKLASVKSKNVSVKEQKQKDKDKAIADGILALGVGGVPGAVGKTGSALLTFLGINSSISQIDKHYDPITVKKYHYVPKKKTGKSGDMNGYNMGYYVIKVYNQKTGKHISSKTIPIQRA